MNENVASLVISSMRAHSCAWFHKYWHVGLPLVMANIQYFSAYLTSKKVCEVYVWVFSALPFPFFFQVAFSTKQKLIRGLELSLAHCVSMVTGLCCSSSKFSLNDLGSFCDPCLLNLDYYDPSMLASYLYPTIASEGGSIPALWTQTLLVQYLSWWSSH